MLQSNPDGTDIFLRTSSLLSYSRNKSTTSLHQQNWQKSTKVSFGDSHLKGKLKSSKDYCNTSYPCHSFYSGKVRNIDRTLFPTTHIDMEKISTSLSPSFFELPSRSVLRVHGSGGQEGSSRNPKCARVKLSFLWVGQESMG